MYLVQLHKDQNDARSDAKFAWSIASEHVSAMSQGVPLLYCKRVFKYQKIICLVLIRIL